MEISKAQEIIDELEAICKKHQVALIGGSESDGIYGEIRIIDVNDLTDDDIDHLSSGDEPYKHNDLTLVNGIA